MENLVKKSIALISTYKINCGIARFAEIVESSLIDDCDVKVYPLERSILKKRFGGTSDSFEQFFSKLKNELPRYDAVNIQYEYSLLSDSTKESIDRLLKIASINKNTTVTFHTIINKQSSGELEYIDYLKKFKFILAAKSFIKSLVYFNPHLEERNLFNKLSFRGVKIIVHTIETQKQLKFLTGSNNIFVHPLCYTNSDDRNFIGNHFENSNYLKNKYKINSDLIIGVFGFFGNYKGFDVALKAIKNLKSIGCNPMLLICSGLHPEDIKNNRTEGINLLNNYIEKNKLNDNVVYTGTLSDLEMYKLIRGVDVCWLPYREVGQEASAIISEVAELGRVALVSRNIPFTEYAKFNIRNDLNFFEIDNYIELAQKTLINGFIDVERRAVMYPEGNYKAGQANFYFNTLMHRQKD
jgi:glycosyltransferase involved in cell wall biosynthesis